MTAASPTLADVVRAGIASEMLELNVCMPGQIVTYDPVKRLVNVQPSLNRKFREAPAAVPLPIIPNVPVMFPSGTTGGFSITWPLIPGDSCILIFSQRSLDKWIDAGAAGPSDSGDNRRHHITDAICYPGSAPTTVPVATDSAAMVIQGPSVKVGATAAEFAVIATKLITYLTTLTTQFNSHTHLPVTAPVGPAVPTTPPAASVPPITQSPPSTAAQIASLILKA